MLLIARYRKSMVAPRGHARSSEDFERRWGLVGGYRSLYSWLHLPALKALVAAALLLIVATIVVALIPPLRAARVQTFVYE